MHELDVDGETENKHHISKPVNLNGKILVRDNAIYLYTIFLFVFFYLRGYQDRVISLSCNVCVKLSSISTAFSERF